MRKAPVLLTGLLLAFVVALAGKPESPSLTITTHKLNLKVGDTADLVAKYVDSNGVKTDTLVTWWVEPDSLGPIDSLFIFTAEAQGEGYIYAELGELRDSIEITVRKPYVPPVEEDLPYLTVLPEDTLLTVGDQLQFSAWSHDSSGNLLDPGVVSWSLIGSPIGTLSETGLFEVTGTGYAFVLAANDSGFGNSLIVAEQPVDTTGANNIVITRDNPSPQGYNVMKTINEGEAWTIGGLPHPLNVLNGGLLYFPMGSLHEDIRLHITLPDFAHIQGDSIEYGYGVVSGLAFHVMVDDTIISPYTFDSPLFVALIFKRGLVRKMGIEPENLTLSYAEIDGDSISFDDTGITNVYVDSVRNRVFSNVAHFSSLALHDREGTSLVGVEGGLGTTPKFFRLGKAWPNPFNPSTLISLELLNNAPVELSVFNLLGQRVAQLHSGPLAAGMHTFRFDGGELSSGIYFIRAASEDGHQAMRKVVLMK